MITITKVVSKNIFVDIIAKFQNLIGKNLTGYQDMVQKGIRQIKDDLEKGDIELEWYRYGYRVD